MHILSLQPKTTNSIHNFILKESSQELDDLRGKIGSFSYGFVFDIEK